MTTEAKHTPEPWTDDHLYEHNGIWIRTLGENSPDWERAKACVNACAGIPTEQLEAGSVAALLKAIDDKLVMEERGYIEDALAPFQKDSKS